MTNIVTKVDFARKHWTAPGGQPFEIDPDDWLYKHYWRPLHSYRLCANDTDALCDECKALAGSLVENYFAADKTRTKRHEATGCKGLYSDVIQFVLLCLKRQSGKTVGTSGYIGAELFKGERESIAFISGSEDQSKELFRVHYREPIYNNPKLKARARVVGNRIFIKSTGSDFIFLPTSLAGATGGTRTKVVIDEARAVPGKVAMALIPTIFAQSGWQCPISSEGHTKTKGDLDEPKRKTCTACKSRLIPWTAKVLIMTSAGELEGGDRDWFFELAESNEEDPHPRAYIYVDEATVNPRVAPSVINATSEFFGKAESLRTYVDIEAHNIPRRKGEDVVTQAEVKRCADKNLGQVTYCNAPAVGFVDTSLSVELTTLLIMADDIELSTDPWERICVPRIDFWKPSNTAIGMVDEREVEERIKLVVPMYPRLKVLYVDTRGMRWALQMVQRLKKIGGVFARIVKPWNRTGDESASGWIDLEKRIREQTIRYPYEKQIFDEFKGLMRKRGRDGSPIVVDRKREKMHKDITECMAVCCHLIGLELLKKASGQVGLSAVSNTKRESIHKLLSTKKKGYSVRGQKFGGPESY